MSNWNVNIEILIRKYKDGTLSNSEAVYLAEWVKSSSQNAQHFRTVVRTIEQLDSQHNVQAERFCKRVIEKEFNKKSARKAVLLPHLNNRWRIAAITSAVATVAIVLGVVFGGRNSSIDVEAPVINGATEEIAIASVPTLEYKAPKDAPMHIVLVDGTKITLNQNSLLTLSDDYNVAERNVTLDGEENGYMVVEVDGSDVKWWYKVLGKDRNYQMRPYTPTRTGDGYLKVNIWNYTVGTWSAVEWWENGVKVGEFEKHREPDSDYAILYADYIARHPKSKYGKPGKSDFMFRIKPSEGVRSGEIRVTDNFGTTYSEKVEW